MCHVWVQPSRQHKVLKATGLSKLPPEQYLNSAQVLSGAKSLEYLFTITKLKLGNHDNAVN